MVNILVVELDRGDESDWKEILAFLKGKMHCQVSGMPIPVPSDEKNRDVLSFPGLELRLKEQIALRDGEPVHLSHYEFFHSVIWRSILAGYLRKGRYMRLYGSSRGRNVKHP